MTFEKVKDVLRDSVKTDVKALGFERNQKDQKLPDIAGILVVRRRDESGGRIKPNNLGFL